jgi:3-phenylpropionate/trans-cinnamate dioxygenase ferredoxin reductase component
MSGTLKRVVVVGASAAGLTAAETLRREGYDGELILVGDEVHPPYDRPPLSKQVLSGAWTPGQVTLRQPGHYDELGLDLRLGRRATSLDVDARTVLLDDTDAVEFDGLVIATGLRPRSLAAAGSLDGVHMLRTLDDAVRLRQGLELAESVVVVGAGVLGCEVAATARSLGRKVTLVDATPQPMMLALGEPLGVVLAQVHRSHGIDLRLSSGVRDVRGAGRVTAVELAGGETVDCDLLVVAIGAVPATDWVEGSGLTLENGVVCDRTCAAAPGIYAAGDIARWENPQLEGALTRVEHRMNATEQGMHVGRALLGSDAAFAPIPYFWSDQFDVKIQAYGHFPPGAEMSLLDGDLGSGRFVVDFRYSGRVVGIIGWSMPGAFRRARNRVQATTVTA